MKVAELLDREPWLWFTFDIAHALAYSMEEAFRYIECCQGRIANVHVSGASPGAIHHTVHGNANIEQILTKLRDTGYEGPLTLEIEDQTFDHDLCSEEKIAVLSRELAFLREIFPSGDK